MVALKWQYNITQTIQLECWKSMNKLSFFLLTLPLSQLDTDRNLNTIICYLHAYTATTTTMIPSSNSSAPQVKSRQCSSHPRHHSHHSRIRKLPRRRPVFPFRWIVGTRHRTWRRIKPSGAVGSLSVQKFTIHFVMEWVGHFFSTRWLSRLAAGNISWWSRRGREKLLSPRDVPRVDSDLVRKFLVYEDGVGVRSSCNHMSGAYAEIGFI